MPSTCMYCREGEAVGQGLNCHLHPDETAALRAELAAAREELKAHKLSHPLSCEGIDSLLDQIKETQKQRDDAFLDSQLNCKANDELVKQRDSAIAQGIAQGKREALEKFQGAVKVCRMVGAVADTDAEERFNEGLNYALNDMSEHIAAELAKLDRAADAASAGKEQGE